MTKTTNFHSVQEMTTSAEVFDAFIDRSWRTNAQRQRDKGIEFVIGRREKAYLWNIEGSKRVVDCGTAGGVHSLGHANPDVAASLMGAIGQGRDTGLWAFPNAEYLKLQDLLAQLAPSPNLNRSVITHCSTISVDLATMIAFRMTGRKKILAYRHGYHGHTGFAALVTGSLDEGILDFYKLPKDHSEFVSTYGDITKFSEMLTDDIAAVIIEPMDYETFAPASRGFLQGVSDLCKKRGSLFILDETRTGLGRSGKIWAAEYFNVSPDILITGKGLSGGFYPVSAVLMTEAIYEHCINEHKFSYLSSLGGNEIACIVAQKVLELISQESLLANVNHVSGLLEKRLDELCAQHGDLFSRGTVFGCIASIQVNKPDLASRLYSAAFEQGILCHSISVTEPTVLKFLPPLVIDAGIVDEIYEGIDRAAHQVKNL